MARVPVITSPCPLRFASMPSVGRDFCGQCKRRVHNLDGMNDAQRAAFFANCSGEVCVAYTVRGPALLAAALGLGAAAAAALTSLPASAQDSGAKPASTVPVVQTGPTCDPKAKAQAIDSLQGVMMGGTSAAQWLDQSDAAIVGAVDRPQIGEIETADWLPMPPAAH
jgi:hypothetical protein